MNQNKLGGLLTLICVVFLIWPHTAVGEETELALSQKAQKSGIKVGLRFMGGGFLVMRNDIHEHIQGMHDIYGDDLFTHSMETEGFGSTRIGSNFTGELFVDFTDNLSLGIGAGTLSHKEQKTIIRDIGCGTIWEHNYYPKISAVPITLSVYYGLPLFPRIRIVFNAGAGYYLGKLDWESDEESTWGQRTEIEWSARSSGLGFHGGIDFEFGITSRLAFVVGTRGRYAKIKGLTGDYNWRTQSSIYGSSSGTLKDMTFWFATWKNMATGKEYPKAVFFANNPHGGALLDSREGEVNFSGFVLQAGLKLIF